jgi:hypothetical protein
VCTGRAVTTMQVWLRLFPARQEESSRNVHFEEEEE